MHGRQAIVVECGRRRLRAVLAAASRESVVIRRGISTPTPPDIAAGDAIAYGRWMNATLVSAGIGLGRVTVALSREDVWLKRLTLPTVEAEELPAMVRLAVQRDLPFDATGAPIDFLPVETSETSTTVLAAAVSQQVLAWVNDILAAAGCSARGITMRTLGLAAMSGDPQPVPSQEGDDAAAPAGRMLVDIADDSVEFCLCAPDGTLRFSRVAELPVDGDSVTRAEAVLTEARRTWSSFQASGDGVPLAVVRVVGDRRTARLCAAAIGDLVGAPGSARLDAAIIQGRPDDLDALAPLAGVLLPRAKPRIDFANPRRAPDLAARKRQRVLLAAGVGIVVILGAFTAIRLNLTSLEDRAHSLEQQKKDQQADFARAWRERYRLEHLRLWESANVDWLDHALYLASVAPPPDALVLDSWTATLDFPGVSYDRQKNTWSAPMTLSIVLDGEARDRETADALRNRLVTGTGYTTTSSGADTRGGKRLPYGFTYRLHTTSVTPPGAPNAEPGKAASSHASVVNKGGGT